MQIAPFEKVAVQFAVVSSEDLSGIKCHCADFSGKNQWRQSFTK
jgi:hypothetical protein